eukprot:5194293-Pyramimonas_sp.AAC.1
MSRGGDAARGLESSRRLYGRAGAARGAYGAALAGAPARAHQRRTAACAQIVGGGTRCISSSWPSSAPLVTDKNRG